MRRRLVAAWIFVIAPLPLRAQAVSGSADWGYSRSSFATEDEASKDSALTQAYTLGYRSVLWDSRFLTYSGELTFNKNAQAFGTEQGRSRQTGFKASASLFPARPFPLSVQASRTTGGETSNYPTSNAIRGGLTLPPSDAVLLDTRQSAFGINWQLAPSRLPRVELSYQKGTSSVAVGPIDAEQHQGSLHALVAREGPRLRNSLRYDRTGFDNALSQAYTQRSSDLSYELTATASSSAAASFRVGRRSTFSLFDVPREFNSIGARSYRPPSTGGSGLYYAVATLNYMPFSRMWSDVSVSYDRERSGANGTNALLGTLSTRYNVIAGLTMNGSATYGQRGQSTSVDRREVAARGVTGGADYTIAIRILQLGAGYDVGQGRTTDELDELHRGRTTSWRARGNASSGALRIVHLNIGYEQGRSRDDLLEFGNLWQERTRATARSAAIGRLTLEASWEQTTIDQGLHLSVARNRYVLTSGSAALDLTRDLRTSLSAGQFVNRSAAGDDGTAYVSVALDGSLAGGLRLRVTARREATTSERSLLDQRGYYATAALEYAVRLFTFALENRYTTLTLVTAPRPSPIAFAGSQILLRVSRRFGFNL